MPEFDDDLLDARTLRDDFAIAALTGALANPDPNTQVLNQSADDFADLAYELADAMMRRREGKQTTFGLTFAEIDRENEVEVSRG